MHPSEMSEKCYMCHSKEKELRPYGIDKQMICLSCLKSSPKTRTEASKQFAEILDGHDDVSVIDRTGVLRKAEESEQQMLKYYGVIK